MPTTRMAIISSVVATGLKTNMRDGFMGLLAGSQPSSRTSTARRSAATRESARATLPALAVLAAAAIGVLRLVLALGLRLGAGLGDFGRRGDRLHEGAQ